MVPFKINLKLHSHYFLLALDQMAPMQNVLLVVINPLVKSNKSRDYRCAQKEGGEKNTAIKIYILLPEGIQY